jgi:hypothetical protein
MEALPKLPSLARAVAEAKPQAVATRPEAG